MLDFTIRLHEIKEINYIKVVCAKFKALLFDKKTFFRRKIQEKY